MEDEFYLLLEATGVHQVPQKGILQTVLKQTQLLTNRSVPIREMLNVELWQNKYLKQEHMHNFTHYIFWVSVCVEKLLHES